MVKIKQVVPLGLLTLVLLACGLLSRSTSFAPDGQAENEVVQREQPTPTVPSALSLHQAWELAWPDIEAWAADAQPAQKWSCPGCLLADGTCNQWQGLVASAQQVDVANVTVTGTGIEVQPSRSEIVGKPAVEAAFARKDLIDSTQAAQTGWDWLAGRALRTEHTRLQGLTLRSGPGSLECGLEPAYVVSFDSPPGQLCLVAYTGAVIYSSYDK
jgi:hypothetical protein